MLHSKTKLSVSISLPPLRSGVNTGPNTVLRCGVCCGCCVRSLDEYGPEESIDESLMYVTANRVGIFRRGKSKCKVVSMSGQSPSTRT